MSALWQALQKTTEAPELDVIRGIDMAAEDVQEVVLCRSESLFTTLRHL